MSSHVKSWSKTPYYCSCVTAHVLRWSYVTVHVSLLMCVHDGCSHVEAHMLVLTRVYVTAHTSLLMCNSCADAHMLLLTCYCSCVTTHMWLLMCHYSYVTAQVSLLICNCSCVTAHVFLLMSYCSCVSAHMLLLMCTWSIVCDQVSHTHMSINYMYVKKQLFIQ